MFLVSPYANGWLLELQGSRREGGLCTESHRCRQVLWGFNTGFRKEVLSTAARCLGKGALLLVLTDDSH